MNLSPPEIGIIILSYQRYETTERLVSQLVNFKWENISIILVDNNSFDKAGKRIKEKFEKIHLIQLEENRGFCGGNNAGIEYCINNNIPYTLILNDDTILAPDFHKKLVDKIAVIPDSIFAIIGKIFCNDENNTVWYAGGKLSYIQGIGKHYGHFLPDSSDYNTPKQVNYLTGCMIFSPTELYSQVGNLKNEIFAYLDDTEFSMRLKKAGIKIYYEPSIVLYHDIGAGYKFKNFTPLYFYYSQRNRVLITESKLYRAYLLGYTLFLYFVKCAKLLFCHPPNTFKKIFSLTTGTMESIKIFFKKLL